jgi:hypothetical protein
MRAHRFDKDATKRLLEQEGIDSSWNTRGVIFLVYEESTGSFLIWLVPATFNKRSHRIYEEAILPVYSSLHRLFFGF